jgi:hypothetical protein
MPRLTAGRREPALERRLRFAELDLRSAHRFDIFVGASQWILPTFADEYHLARSSCRILSQDVAAAAR